MQIVRNRSHCSSIVWRVVVFESIDRDPQIKKGFALSAWDIYENIRTKRLPVLPTENKAMIYFVRIKIRQSFICCSNVGADFQTVKKSSGAIAIKQC